MSEALLEIVQQLRPSAEEQARQSAALSQVLPSPHHLQPRL